MTRQAAIPPAQPARPAGRLLREERDFRHVYISQLISLGGDWFAIIPLLTLLPRLTGLGIWGALVLTADTLVFAMLAPYAGTVVDRVDRRILMVTADLLSAVLIALLLFVRSDSTAWISLVAIGGVAAAKSFYAPAANAALPNLIPAQDLATANALNGAAWGVMLAVGAALGGLAAELFGTSWCFGIDAVSFVISGALVASARKPFSEAREVSRKSSARADIKEAIAYARADHRVIALLTCKPGTAFGNGVLALFPLLALNVFHIGGIGVGLLFGARGLGALIGPFVGRRFIRRDADSLWKVLAVSISFYGVAYMAFALTSWFPLALAFVVLAHIGASTNWNLSAFALQSSVPDYIRGRVFSADFMLGTLTLGLSQLVTGALAEVLDARWLAFGLAATVFVYGGIWYAATARARAPVDHLRAGAAVNTPTPGSS
ncbi:MAG: MFS transporter [Actinomycetota bacterium]